MKNSATVLVGTGWQSTSGSTFIKEVYGGYNYVFDLVTGDTVALRCDMFFFQRGFKPNLQQQHGDIEGSVMIEVDLSADAASVFVARLRDRVPDANPVYDDGKLLVDDGPQSDIDAIVDLGLALTKDELKPHAALVRYEKKVGGTMLNGIACPSDRQTQAKLTAGALFAQVDNTQTWLTAHFRSLCRPLR